VLPAAGSHSTDVVGSEIAGTNGGRSAPRIAASRTKQILDAHGSSLTSFNYAALERACTWGTRSFFGLAASGVGVVGAWSR
jgi:hypothetical protein